MYDINIEELLFVVPKSEYFPHKGTIKKLRTDRNNTNCAITTGIITQTGIQFKNMNSHTYIR